MEIEREPRQYCVGCGSRCSMSDRPCCSYLVWVGEGIRGRAPLETSERPWSLMSLPERYRNIIETLVKRLGGVATERDLLMHVPVTRPQLRDLLYRAPDVFSEVEDDLPEVLVQNGIEIPLLLWEFPENEDADLEFLEATRIYATEAAHDVIHGIRGVLTVNSMTCESEEPSPVDGRIVPPES
jgi:hypothetical protein